MSVKLSDILKDAIVGDEVAPRVSNYEQRYGGDGRGDSDERKRDYKNYVTTYYDLVTDFYEYGWGQSFHFAPRAPYESFPASLARHEHYIAHMLGLRPGMVAADLGCGVGGPLREIIRFSGAKIVGVSNNAYQLERARKQTEEAGLSHLAEFLECDFMQVEAPDASFDAVFAIEATASARSKFEASTASITWSRTGSANAFHHSSGSYEPATSLSANSSGNSVTASRIGGM